MLQSSRPWPLVALAATIGLGLAASPALAQEESIADVDQELLDLLNVTITSASQQEESLKEAPVPVTVITSEMIRTSGARNLKDVLVTFVPGITFAQDHNEVNVAMRGIYGSSQQKMLFLLDGHRLNSRAYSHANPDFSISLAKIKQIEVLRGPASVLYGNVALTGVVNLITKTGEDVNGTETYAGVGDYGQLRAGFLHGAHGEGQDLMLWGDMYQADGQAIPIPQSQDFSDKPQAGSAIVDGFKDKPSHDVGMTYRFGDFTLLANSRYSKYIEPFSAGGDTGEVYNYDDFRTFQGVGPGLGSGGSTHLGLTYNKVLDADLDFKFNAYRDTNDMTVALVTDPAAKAYGFVNWNDADLGFLTQLTKGYQLGKLGDGSLIVGGQVDTMALLDSSFPAGVGGDLTKFNDTQAKRVLETGKGETIYSAFGNVKHKFSDAMILNAGLRYDEKERHEGPNIRNVSPRLAFIYLPTSNVELKTSYAQSFVDAPYWYRYNSLASYAGSRDLKPELLSTLQFSPTVRLLDNHLQNTVNVYYQNLHDFIYRDHDPHATQKYRNAGGLESWGIEEEIAYLQDAYRLRANGGFQQALKAMDYPATAGEIANVPAYTGNLIADFNPFHALYKDCWFNLTARYVGSQWAPIGQLNQNGAPFSAPGNRVQAALLFNTGVHGSLPFWPALSYDATVYNLMDTPYLQGGSTPFPYPQAGRWFMTTLSYRW